MYTYEYLKMCTIPGYIIKTIYNVHMYIFVNLAYIHQPVTHPPHSPLKPKSQHHAPPLPSPVCGRAPPSPNGAGHPAPLQQVMVRISSYFYPIWWFALDPDRFCAPDRIT